MRFREGEVARIYVNNRLANEENSVHWHGPLGPNLQDGVPYISLPIPSLAKPQHAFVLNNKP